MEQTVNAAIAAPENEKAPETQSFFKRFFGKEKLEDREKKVLAKAMDSMVKNQQGFMRGYHDLVVKYGYDFMAVPVFQPIGRDAIPADKLARLQKTIGRALSQEHVRLDARFQLIPRVNRPEEKPDGNANT